MVTLSEKLEGIDKRLRAVPTHEECINAVSALLAFMKDHAPTVIQALKAGEWQDIERAPRDVPILAWGDNWRWSTPHVAYYHSDYNGHKDIVTEGRCGVGYSTGARDRPTHFRPLPTPPSENSHG